MNDSLIKIRPETDFEKLLFAQSEIKELYKKISKLEIETGKLIAERDEYRYELNKYLSVCQKDDWKKKYELLLRGMKRKRQRIRSLQDTNKELITRLIKFENE